MPDKNFTASELLAVMSARLLKDGQIVFAGVGIPLLFGVSRVGRIDRGMIGVVRIRHGAGIGRASRHLVGWAKAARTPRSCTVPDPPCPRGHAGQRGHGGTSVA